MSLARGLKRRQLKKKYKEFKKQVQGGNKTIKRELRANKMDTNLATLGTLTIEKPKETKDVVDKTKDAKVT